VNATPDTNILVRAIMRDDPSQFIAADQFLEHTEVLTLSISSLCEVVWVLRVGYRLPPARIEFALRTLSNAQNVVVDRLAFEAGMIFVRNNGDFADGVIAYEGRSMGSDTFVSFDKKAVSLLKSQGHSAKLLS